MRVRGTGSVGRGVPGKAVARSGKAVNRKGRRKKAGNRSVKKQEAQLDRQELQKMTVPEAVDMAQGKTQRLTPEKVRRVEQGKAHIKELQEREGKYWASQKSEDDKGSRRRGKRKSKNRDKKDLNASKERALNTAVYSTLSPTLHPAQGKDLRGQELDVAAQAQAASRNMRDGLVPDGSVERIQDRGARFAQQLDAMRSKIVDGQKNEQEQALLRQGGERLYASALMRDIRKPEKALRVKVKERGARGQEIMARSARGQDVLSAAVSDGAHGLKRGGLDLVALDREGHGVTKEKHKGHFEHFGKHDQKLADQLLEKHFYTLADVKKVAEKLERFETDLRQAHGELDVISRELAASPSDAKECKKDVMARLQERTGLSYEQLLQERDRKREDLKELRDQHMEPVFQPVMQQVEARLAHLDERRDKARRELSDVTSELLRQKAYLENWDKNKVRVQVALDKCRKKIDKLPPLKSAEVRNEKEYKKREEKHAQLKQEEARLNAELDVLVDLEKKERQRSSVADLTAEKKSMERQVAGLSDEVEYAGDQKRVLKKMITGFSTDAQVEQAEKLAATEARLLDLGQENRVVCDRQKLFCDAFLHNLRVGQWKDALDCFKEFRVNLKRNWALNKEIVRAVANVNRLYQQLDIDPAIRMIQKNAEKKPVPSDQVWTLLTMGFTDVKPVYRSAADGRVRVELSALDDERALLRGKALWDRVQNMQEAQESQEREEGLDRVRDRVLTATEEVLPNFREELEDALDEAPPALAPDQADFDALLEELKAMGAETEQAGMLPDGSGMSAVDPASGQEEEAEGGLLGASWSFSSAADLTASDVLVRAAREARQDGANPQDAQEDDDEQRRMEE